MFVQKWKQFCLKCVKERYYVTNFTLKTFMWSHEGFPDMISVFAVVSPQSNGLLHFVPIQCIKIPTIMEHCLYTSLINKQMKVNKFLIWVFRFTNLWMLWKTNMFCKHVFEIVQLLPINGPKPSNYSLLFITELLWV